VWRLAEEGATVKYTLTALAGMALVAGSANAAFFSFASDTADHHWTFFGGPAANQFRDGILPGGKLDLLVDDNNGPLPTLTFSTRLIAQFDLAYAGSIPLGNGDFSHNYFVSGEFTFLDLSSMSPLLVTTFSGGLFTARGGQDSWYSTAGFGADNFGAASINMSWHGSTLPGYGLQPGQFVDPQGFQYTLSALNTSGQIPYDMSSQGVTLNRDMYPSQQWFAEGSYSASSNVPTPGALVLTGMGIFAAARRRRA
jgi:MYXO-CTERM domain-containing protein